MAQKEQQRQPHNAPRKMKMTCQFSFFTHFYAILFSCVFFSRTFFFVRNIIEFTNEMREQNGGHPAVISNDHLQ